MTDIDIDGARIFVGLINPGDQRNAGIADTMRADYTRQETPYVWWDGINDPAAAGWVLRVWADGDWEDIILDANDPDHPQAALDEAARHFPRPGFHPSDMRASLTGLGERRASVEAQRAEITFDLGQLVPRARKAGLTVIEIAALTGLSRRAVYDITG